MAYADDLLAVSSNINDLVEQAHKFEAFTKWAGMKVNYKKCGVTGMLYNYVISGLLDIAMSTKGIQMLDSKLAQLMGNHFRSISLTRTHTPIWG